MVLGIRPKSIWRIGMNQHRTALDYSNTEAEINVNIQDIKLADVIDIDIIQRLQDDFAKGVGVASIVVDLDGNPVTHPSSYTSFCMNYTHATEAGDKRCAESHRKGGEEAARLGKPVVYECHAGLIDFAAPIILEGRQIGTVLGGQVLTEMPNEEKYRKVAQEIGTDEEGYIKAVKEIRQLSRESVEAAANVLYIVANSMSTIQYNQQRLVKRSKIMSYSVDEIYLAMQDMEKFIKKVKDDHSGADKKSDNIDIIANKINEVIKLTKCIATMMDKQNQEMSRLDRLNVAGKMAISIGHEVRNPLTTVRGFLQFFHAKPEFSKYAGDLGLMIEELDSANSIITEFLSLAENRKLNLKILDLNQIIKKIVPRLQENFRCKQVQIEFEFETLPRLLLDEKEIEKLILNLVTNAIEATRNNGIVTIKTFRRDQQLGISIYDEGCGISKRNLEKIGTPFFSTKFERKGLGLAVCYRIAERHAASLHIHSTKDIGTTVEVLFNHST